MRKVEQIDASLALSLYGVATSIKAVGEGLNFHARLDEPTLSVVHEPIGTSLVLASDAGTALLQLIRSDMKLLGWLEDTMHTLVGDAVGPLLTSSFTLDQVMQIVEAADRNAAGQSWIEEVREALTAWVELGATEVWLQGYARNLARVRTGSARLPEAA